MKKMLEKSPTRRHDFYHLIFRPDQSHVLGAAATANIGLLFCEFSDKGEAFLTAYRQKEESDTTCRYSFSGELPFEATVWLDFLKQPRRFETLELNWFFYGYSETMNGEALDHALCSSKRATLILAQHEFTDGGSALIDCIKSKTSCRSIVVDRCNDFSFGKFDWNPTFEALRGCDNHLKEVELVLPWSVLQDRPTSAFYPSLVGALLKNMGLKRLVLRNVHTNDRENVILSLIPHRTLRYLTIDNPSFEWKWGVEVKAFTYKIVSLLEANECLEHIDVPKYSIDPGVWKALVVPKLKANCERNRLVDVSRIKRASLRAAVLGAVLVKESKDPSKFWSSIVMNQDTVLQFLSYVEYCNVRQENKKKTRTHQQQGKTTLPDRTAGGSKVKKLNEHTGLPHQEGPNHKRNDEKDCKQAEVPCFHLLGFLQNIFPKKQSALV